MHIRRLNSAGDTIVEVLIALAVTSALLGGAYASTNNSLNGSRISQERAQALKIAEAQVESLRALTTVTGLPAAFCIINPAAPTTLTTPPATANLETPATFALYGACQQGLYYVSIVHPNPPSANTFNVRVRWERAGGGQNEEVGLVYSIY